MFCEICGSELKEDKVCSTCGSPVSVQKLKKTDVPHEPSVRQYPISTSSRRDRVDFVQTISTPAGKIIEKHEPREVPDNLGDDIQRIPYIRDVSTGVILGGIIKIFRIQWKAHIPAILLVGALSLVFSPYLQLNAIARTRLMAIFLFFVLLPILDVPIWNYHVGDVNKSKQRTIFSNPRAYFYNLLNTIGVFFVFLMYYYIQFEFPNLTAWISLFQYLLLFIIPFLLIHLSFMPMLSLHKERMNVASESISIASGMRIPLFISNLIISAIFFGLNQFLVIITAVNQFDLSIVNQLLQIINAYFILLYTIVVYYIHLEYNKIIINGRLWKY